MKTLFFVLYTLFMQFLGAYSHEEDIARNCKEQGNARAWFNNIECGDSNNERKPKMERTVRQSTETFSF